MLEAKTVWLPFFENFRISPTAAALSSATKRSPEGSKAIPRGSARLVANVLSVPSGANTRIASPPGPPSFPSVVTQRFPDRSKVRPTGPWTLVKAAGPTKTLEAPAGVNLKMIESVASEAKRLPAASKAMPRLCPGTKPNVLPVPSGVNLKMVLAKAGSF